MVWSASWGVPQNSIYPEGHVSLCLTFLHVPVSAGACFVELSIKCQVLLSASQQPKHLWALPLLPTQDHPGSVQQGDALGTGAGPLCDGRYRISELSPFLQVVQSVLLNCCSESAACVLQSFPRCNSETCASLGHSPLIWLASVSCLLAHLCSSCLQKLGSPPDKRLPSWICVSMP